MLLHGNYLRIEDRAIGYNLPQHVHAGPLPCRIQKMCGSCRQVTCTHVVKHHEVFAIAQFLAEHHVLSLRNHMPPHLPRHYMSHMTPHQLRHHMPHMAPHQSRHHMSQHSGHLQSSKDIKMQGGSISRKRSTGQTNAYKSWPSLARPEDNPSSKVQHPITCPNGNPGIHRSKRIWRIKFADFPSSKQL